MFCEGMDDIDDNPGGGCVIQVDHRRYILVAEKNQLWVSGGLREGVGEREQTDHEGQYGRQS